MQLTTRSSSDGRLPLAQAAALEQRAAGSRRGVNWPWRRAMPSDQLKDHTRSEQQRPQASCRGLPGDVAKGSRTCGAEGSEALSKLRPLARALAMADSTSFGPWFRISIGGLVNALIRRAAKWARRYDLKDSKRDRAGGSQPDDHHRQRMTLEAVTVACAEAPTGAVLEIFRFSPRDGGGNGPRWGKLRKGSAGVAKKLRKRARDQMQKGDPMAMGESSGHRQTGDSAVISCCAPRNWSGPLRSRTMVSQLPKAVLSVRLGSSGSTRAATSPSVGAPQRERCAQVLSSNPGSGRSAWAPWRRCGRGRWPAAAARAVEGAAGHPVPPTLLRAGRPTLLLITRGFADALWIGVSTAPICLPWHRSGSLYRQC